MLLFVNACLREESRTERLARMWLERRAYEGEVVELRLAGLELHPLDVAGPAPLTTYNQAVAAQDYSDPLFDFAKQFASADEAVIAAPMWNYTVPGKLGDYLELVCSQGVTFDIDATGAYVSLCHLGRLTFVTTAGGAAVAPEDDHCFGLVRTLGRRFWGVAEPVCVAAWGLDAPDANVDILLADALG